MIDPGSDAQDEQVLSISNNTLVPTNPNMNIPEHVPTGIGFDNLTGTLTMAWANGLILKAEGLPTSTSGKKGDKGDRGERGASGRNGQNGKDGRDGKRGCQGRKGDRGEKGEKGDQGLQGERGEKGDKGERGERGEQGRKGDPGQEPVLIPGNPAYERVLSSNRVIAWGRYFDTETSDVTGLTHKADVLFPDANIADPNNVTVVCFFKDGKSVQALNYEVEDISSEKFMLSLPESFNGQILNDPWDFHWIVLGY